ncbi:MAG: biopolymer transporter ExbD [Planctomycetales bacterium]|nr:biopolymer transporter ExbD [Planctomycetales bacterium]
MSRTSELPASDAEELEVEADFLRPRPPISDDELDITPMIDITFLLLIFFLVSSKLSAEQAVDLPPARHGGVVAGKESVIVIMRRGTGDLAEVRQADGTLFSLDPEQQNAEIAEYVQQGLDAGKKHVIIRAEGAVRHGEVGRVSGAISESLDEGALINIAVMEQT